VKEYLETSKVKKTGFFFSDPHIQQPTKYTPTFDFSGLNNYHFTATTKGGFWRPIPIISHEGPLQVSKQNLQDQNA
jgi:hypothetical protein